MIESSEDGRNLNLGTSRRLYTGNITAAHAKGTPTSKLALAWLGRVMVILAGKSDGQKP